MNTQNNTKPNRTVLLAVADRFADSEYEETRRILENAGFTVQVASNEVTTLTGMSGLQVQAEYTFGEIEPNRFGGFLIIGGEGVIKHFWPNVILKNTVVSFVKAGKITGAICAAPPVLARAGILRNLSATAYPFDEAIHEIKAGGGIYQNSPVVVQGNIITGRDPEATTEFAETACQLLNAFK